MPDPDARGDARVVLSLELLQHTYDNRRRMLAVLRDIHGKRDLTDLEPLEFPTSRPAVVQDFTEVHAVGRKWNVDVTVIILC